LSRTEFERRYQAAKDIKKAELIEGIVYMPSPVRFWLHAEPQSVLSGLFLYYRMKTPGVLTGDNGTVRLSDENEPQPDAFLLLPPHVGGRTKVDDDGYVAGPPALVCEIAASSVSIDLHHKRTAYARHGVREYIVWRVEDEAVDWFVLKDGEYATPQPAEGLLKSKQFPGLWLDVAALLRGDLPALFAAIDRGVAAPEHAEFVRRLNV
jgi:Uma2 family endonuclease